MIHLLLLQAFSVLFVHGLKSELRWIGSTKLEDSLSAYQKKASPPLAYKFGFGRRVVMLFKLALPPLSREEQCLFDNTTNGGGVCQLKKVKLEEDRVTARAVFFMEIFCSLSRWLANRRKMGVQSR